MLSQLNKGPMRVSLTLQGCFGGVVAARYDTCDEPVSLVSYSQLGTDFVITAFSVHPLSSIKEAHLAGDLIDSALELEALKHNVKQLLIVPPGKSTAEFVREYKFNPFVMGLGASSQTTTYIN